VTAPAGERALYRKPSMNRPDPAPDSPRHWISDLTDGRLDGGALATACRAWATDGEARRTWHAYHLVGDVLRSDALARDARHDAAFLAALRARLAAEPVVLAPTRPRRQVWLAPLAAAAGFVAVAGVVVVLRQAAPPPGASGPQLAGGPLAVPARADPAAEAMYRAQVEDYMRAHREALAGSPAALPGGGLRTVDFSVPQR
jgi:sigma-E factor negative regulatory protein RseA